MRNKTIAMASALLVSGVLVLNSVAFADTAATTTTTTAAQQKPAKAYGKMMDRNGGFKQKGAMGMHGQQMFGQDWSNKLKELVAAGTINQATADKIQVYITEQEAARKAELEKLQGMTAEQRKAYMESKKTEAVKRQDLLSAVVEKGIITQQQADTIKAKFQADQQAKMQESIKTSLAQLVTNNTITADQSAKVLDYVTKQQAARAAEMEKVKAMTQAERDAYFKANPPTKNCNLAQLVTDKVLTQEQANAVQKALHLSGGQKCGNPGMQRGMQKGMKGTVPPQI